MLWIEFIIISRNERVTNTYNLNNSSKNLNKKWSQLYKVIVNVKNECEKISIKQNDPL